MNLPDVKMPAKAEIRLNADLPSLLLGWYDKHARDLPWRRDREPYHVWLSEIMLQQTRVEAARDYYLRFLERLPTVEALAAADEEILLKLWEGLGYYSRARNLHKTAKLIANEYGGRFPDTFEALLKLPGVGAYTAGAIASICFEKPVPAVDGNVLRVVSRVAGVAEPMDTPGMKGRVSAALAKLYPAGRCGAFTQSLMELGATVCLPNGAPRCGECPVSHLCWARQNGAVASLPVKQEKKQRRTEHVTVLALTCGGALAIRRREGGGLLGGLWELPNVSGELDEAEALALALAWGALPVSVADRAKCAHVFTHVRWEMTCYSISCAEKPARFVWADRASLAGTYALPSAFRKLLKEGADDVR